MMQNAKIYAGLNLIRTLMNFSMVIMQHLAKRMAHDTRHLCSETIHEFFLFC